jgi:hypothetical protein
VLLLDAWCFSSVLVLVLPVASTTSTVLVLVLVLPVGAGASLRLMSRKRPVAEWSFLKRQLPADEASSGWRERLLGGAKLKRVSNL